MKKVVSVQKGIILTAFTLTVLVLFVAPLTTPTVMAHHRDWHGGGGGGGDDETTNSIDVCCAWNEKLADGDLTYKISGGDATSQQTVRDAVEEWEVVVGLTLTEVFGNVKADIDVKFKKGGGMIAGQAVRKFDGNFIDSVRLSVSGSAFGDANNQATIAQVVRHEMGHALGAGHANFDGVLMSPTVQGASEDIKECDKDAVKAANHWKLVDGVVTPHVPHVDEVECPPGSF